MSIVWLEENQVRNESGDWGVVLIYLFQSQQGWRILLLEGAKMMQLNDQGNKKNSRGDYHLFWKKYDKSVINVGTFHSHIQDC